MNAGRPPRQARRGGPVGTTARGRAVAAGCAEARQALGVYVLGAISPAERALVDRHLAVCRDCRDELAGLAGLPGLLGCLTLSAVDRLRGLRRPPRRG
jgi:hypothetical protein